jgi:hypothetical protein
VEEKDIDLDGTKLPTPGVFDDGTSDLPASQLAEIIRLIDNPEATDLATINRLIAREIAITLADPTVIWGMRGSASDKIKAMRELAKTLQEGDTLSKKDFLNFDGPKFRYVLGELVHTFRSSLKSSGLAEDVVNHVLRIFRDQLTVREPDLRKETDRVTTDNFHDSVPVATPAPIPPAEG